MFLKQTVKDSTTRERTCHVYLKVSIERNSALPYSRDTLIMTPPLFLREILTVSNDKDTTKIESGHSKPDAHKRFEHPAPHARSAQTLVDHPIRPLNRESWSLRRSPRSLAWQARPSGRPASVPRPKGPPRRQLNLCRGIQIVCHRRLIHHTHNTRITFDLQYTPGNWLLKLCCRQIRARLSANSKRSCASHGPCRRVFVHHRPAYYHTEYGIPEKSLCHCCYCYR